MANKKIVKVPIDSTVLYTLIKSKTSIRKLGPEIGYSEKTIRRGLDDSKMTIELVFLIGKELSVDPKDFADFDTYCELLKS